MKTTRQIFVITGNESAIQMVLNEVSGFKAITVINGLVSPDKTKQIFANNKSVVCKGLAKETLILQLTPIYITASNGYYSIPLFGNVIDIRQNIVLQFMEIASRYNIDIGDHIANSTGKEGPSKNNCILCKIIEGNPVHEQAPLYETKNFLVVPGSGAFIDGYLMIIPKEHIMSYAELPAQEQEEMNKVIQDIKFLLMAIYHKDVLIWENGSGSGGHGKPKTSIVHAHIHACPSTLNILQTTKITGIALHEIHKEDLINYSKDSYLLVIDYDNRWYISSDNNLYIPRQYVRQLVALEQNIGGDLWDWRKFPFWNNVEKTGIDFLNYVRKNFNYLPYRIQKATKQFL